MEALVSFKVTIEHDYVSLLLSMDGLRHALLSGIPVTRDPDSNDYELSKQQFLTLRPEIIASKCCLPLSPSHIERRLIAYLSYLRQPQHCPRQGWRRKDDV